MNTNIIESIIGSIYSEEEIWLQTWEGKQQEGPAAFAHLIN